MRPLGSFGGRVSPDRMIAHCLLVERPEGLLLVDTGFGSADIADPGRLGRPFTRMVRPALQLAETARAQIQALGHDAADVTDVTDIALTHLDLDHVGGIGDFGSARIHVFGDELAAAQHPTWRERARYLSAQWAHRPQWVRHEVAGDEWFGFGSVTALCDDVVLVPLRGHTRGHCGVAVRRDEGGWLLHAGDSYFATGEKQTPPSAPVGLKVFQSVLALDNAQRLENQHRLQELHATRGSEVTIFSAHDVSEFEALAGS